MKKPPESSPGTERAEGNAGREILSLVQEQVDLGPRVPGTGAHDALVETLESSLREYAEDVALQEFTVPFLGQKLHCANVIGAFRARGESVRNGPILLGTHFDTRPRADREADPARRECPIPGANDGGSGTAVLLHALPRLAGLPLERDVIVVFFDAEDLGNIDGLDFSIGAAHCADHPLGGEPLADVIVLDLVGGAGMVFDISAHILSHAPSRRLTLDVYRLGAAQGWKPFSADKPERLKYVIADHHPFAERGIASCLLIDLDYPQWHTQDDTPSFMSAESLGITEAAVLLFLSQNPG
ncbi:MAG TPA: M28 family peptidase [Spirochaetia bacterium]|nr:M28 family peptidase [Spirochaetia bacterium]